MTHCQDWSEGQSSRAKVLAPSDFLLSYAFRPSSLPICRDLKFQTREQRNRGKDLDSQASSHRLVFCLPSRSTPATEQERG